MGKFHILFLLIFQSCVIAHADNGNFRQALVVSDSLTTAADNAAKAGDYDFAIQKGTENVTLLKNALYEDNDYTAAALYDLSRFFALKGDWERAWKNASSAASMWKFLYSDKNINYVLAMSDAAYYNSRRGNLRFGKEDAEKCVKIAEENQFGEMKCYGHILTNMACAYMLLEDYEHAIENANKALAVIDRDQGKSTREYARALSLLADATSRTSRNQDEAIRLAAAALNIQNRLLPKFNFERALTLCRLSLAHLRNSDAKTSMTHGKEAICIWDSLHTLPPEYENCAWQMAVNNYYDQKFDESLALCSTLLELSERTNTTQSLDYSERLSLMAGNLFELGRQKEAVEHQQKSISVIENKSKQQPSLVNAYFHLARFQLAVGDYDKAVKSQTRSVKLSEKLYKGARQHTDALSRLAAVYEAGDDYASAVKTQSLCNELLSAQNGGNETELINGMNNLASYQTRAGMNDAAYATELELIELYSRRDTVNNNFVTALNNAAIYANKCGNTAEAKNLQRRSLNIMQKFIPPANGRYIDALTMMINYCTAEKDFAAAADYQQKKANATSQKYGKYSGEYASELQFYASLLSVNKRYADAIENQQEAIAVLERIAKDTEHTHDAKNLLSSYYSMNGDFEKANEISTELTNEIAKGTTSSKHIQELAQAASHQQSVGNNAEALRLSAEALKILEQTEAKGTKEHAKALNDIAAYYAMVHDNKEAIAHGRKAVEIFESIADTANLSIALNNLALFHIRIKEDAVADSLSNLALRLQAQSTGEDSPEYANILNNVASNKYNAGNVEEAIALSEKAMAIFDSKGMDNTLEYAGMLNNRSVYMLYLDKTAEAVALRKKALEIRRKVLGERHPDYLHSLVGLCTMLESNGQTDELVTHAAECTDLITDMLRRQFMSLPAKERSSYWNAWNNWYQNLMPRYTQENPVPEMISAAYEGTIFAKGLMLNSECNLKDLIAESSSPETDQLYTDLQSIRKKLNELYDKGAKSNVSQTDSMEHEAAALERRLVSASREYGDYTANLSIPASAVKANLHHGDAAVEFVSFNDGTTNQYYAFLLTAEDTVPKFIKIASEKEIFHAKNNRNELSRTVWTPVAMNLSPDIRQIFFAPAGDLYNLPIEYLPDHANGSADISERWELHRLSSTRQIARLHPTDSPQRACIIGGLTYNTDGTPSPYDLPHTETEARNISSQLSTQIPEVKLLTGNNGDESALRELSGKGYSLLHIATHGFCISEEDADYLACDIFHSDFMAEGHAEDNMLKRSGLMLHGGGPTLLGRGPKDRNNDGVLTAMEIAQLDLRGLDLAVLSACQTALGDVTGEGVFGLQRGFKKAGTKSLLMSLWKVDDSATQLLMSRFYANLTAGMSKKASLSEAQQYLRTYTSAKQTFEDEEPVEGFVDKQPDLHPYSSPDYWAAFILLDAIN